MEGAGTEFKITISNPTESITNSSLEKNATDQLENGYNILIAEDGDVNYIFLKTLLERHSEFDLKIYRATNGKEAVELCERGIAFSIVFYGHSNAHNGW